MVRPGQRERGTEREGERANERRRRLTFTDVDAARRYTGPGRDDMESLQPAKIEIRARQTTTTTSSSK